MARVKRRRSSGLRGTPAEHAKESARTFKLAIDNFKSARELMRSDDCVGAFERLVTGQKYTAMAFDNGMHAPRIPSTDLLREAEKVQDAVKRACVVGGGSLRGLGRRPTRRKR